MKFHVSSRKSEILHSNGFFLSKSYKFWAKKVQKSYLSLGWRVMQSLKRNWLVLSHMTWGICWIFTQPLKSLKYLFDGLFLYKVYKLWAIKIQRNYLSWHWTVMRNLNKPWPLGFKTGARNWRNFYQSILKSEKLYFHRLFLSKSYNISARKFHRNYVSWHWRMMQYLNKNWLVVWKTTYGIW